ncbi:hypothetical protein EES42_15990 [Streptomyces sp. ADI95-17]|nr:hypothetical protein EES42_15990 [Streptomyces sp. ADI95-17]
MKEGVTAPQTGQGEESLTTCGKTPPRGPDLPTPHSEPFGQAPRGATGQVDRRRADKRT